MRNPVVARTNGSDDYLCGDPDDPLYDAMLAKLAADMRAKTRQREAELEREVAADAALDATILKVGSPRGGGSHAFPGDDVVININDDVGATIRTLASVSTSDVDSAAISPFTFSSSESSSHSSSFSSSNSGSSSSSSSSRDSSSGSASSQTEAGTSSSDADSLFVRRNERKSARSSTEMRSARSIFSSMTMPRRASALSSVRLHDDVSDLDVSDTSLFDSEVSDLTETSSEFTSDAWHSNGGEWREDILGGASGVGNKGGANQFEEVWRVPAGDAAFATSSSASSLSLADAGCDKAGGQNEQNVNRQNMQLDEVLSKLLAL
jgi:hypothetical protein